MKRVCKLYTSVCQKIGAALQAPTKVHGQMCLFGIGAGLLVLGFLESSHAQAAGIPASSVIVYNDRRVNDTIAAILAYIEGSFGALVMVCAGLGAIISAAFGGYKAALGLLVVAVGAFILRSLVSTFFGSGSLPL